MKLWGIEIGLILVIGSLLPAAALIYQDFHRRLISLDLVVVFGVLLTVSSLFRRTFSEVTVDFLINSCFILISLVCVLCVLQIKQGSQKLLDVFGLGDVVIWFILAIAIDPAVTPAFFTMIFFAAIAGYLFIHRKSGTIPLAGYMLIGYTFYVLCPL